MNFNCHQIFQLPYFIVVDYSSKVDKEIIIDHSKIQKAIWSQPPGIYTNHTDLNHESTENDYTENMKDQSRVNTTSFKTIYKRKKKQHNLKISIQVLLEYNYELIINQSNYAIFLSLSICAHRELSFNIFEFLTEAKKIQSFLTHCTHKFSLSEGTDAEVLSISCWDVFTSV